MKTSTVIAAKAVIHFKSNLILKYNQQFMDSRLRGNDETAVFVEFSIDENYDLIGEKQ